MAPIILDKPKVPAREIVTAPRLPAFPRDTYKSPFDANGDVVADCAVAGCTYHVMGPRTQVGFKVREHHRLYHSDQLGVVLLNQPRQ